MRRSRGLFDPERDPDERVRPDGDDRRERHFRMNMKTGEIREIRAAGAPERQDDEEQWVQLGELGPSIDYSRARGWRPLRDFLWRR